MSGALARDWHRLGHELAFLCDGVGAWIILALLVWLIVRAIERRK